MIDNPFDMVGIGAGAIAIAMMALGYIMAIHKEKSKRDH